MYLDNGYLDIEYIAKLADENKINFIFIFGERQVGKTYGVLRYQLVHQNIHILLRRSITEMRFISVDVNNPYLKIPEGKNVQIRSQSEYTRAIYNGEDDIGMVAALSTIANIRGFNGDRYTDLVFDECVPEKHVHKFTNEGDAFLNAYVTIAGNRELEGKNPLRCWFLANTNDINGAVIQSFKIAEVIMRMQKTHKELSILSDRGIMVINCNARDIRNKRSTTAVYKAIGLNNNFSRMSLGAEYVYNDMRNISNNINLVEFVPVCILSDKHSYNFVCMWVHKSKDLLYFSNYNCKKKLPMYTLEQSTMFLSEYVNTIVYIRNNSAFFENIDVKIFVFDFLRLKL